MSDDSSTRSDVPSDAARAEDALSEKASAVCLACGLCCDGALYTHVSLSGEAEIVFAEGMELNVVHLDGEPFTGDFFLLPCRYLDDKKCSIYHERFDRCRSYQCMLTQNIRAGKVELDHALDVVRDLRRRFDYVMAHLNPGGSPLSIADLVRREVDLLPGGSVKDLPAEKQRAFLELVALAGLLKRHIDPRINAAV